MLGDKVRKTTFSYGRKNILKNLIRCGLILTLLSILGSTVSALSLNYYDGWVDYDGGTTSDGIVWGGYTLETYASSVNSYADCLCWDWCDDGTWDHCFCKSSSAQSQCESYSITVNTVCGRGDCGVGSLTNDHPIGTGSSGDKWTCNVDVREYRDCDNSAGQRGYFDYDSVPYYVISPKKYDCDNTDYYDLEGEYGSNVWKDVVKDMNCGSTKACDENHDDQNVDEPLGSIPDPCRTKNGYLCGANDECISDNCAGSNQVYYRSHCTSSSQYQKQYNEHDPCCGSECTSGWISCFGNYNCGSGSECDYDNPEEDKLYGPYSGNHGSECSNMADLCKKSDGQSCSSASDCLTNHYCVHGTCRSTSYYCGDGYCDTGETWCEADSCDPCSSSQCVSYRWESCHNHDTLCCSGDPVFGQYHCNDDNSWSECSSSVHTGCQQKGTYYCTNDDGDWYWRECSAGCLDSKCIGCKDYNSDSVINSQDTEEAIKIYFELPGKIDGFTVSKAEVLDCINKYP